MATAIRLRRIGKNPKKNPHFRISVLDDTRSRDGRIIEELGYYNPVTGVIKLKIDNYAKWVKNGAVVSQTLKNLVKKAS